MYGTILVPLDGSAASEHVLPIAAGLARALRARIELLRVYSFRPVDYGAESYVDAGYLEEQARSDARRYLDEVADSIDASPQPVTAVVREHHFAAEAIRHEAVVCRAGLIAMTTHGRTGLRRTVLGSVADDVLRHLTLPMLLWKAAEGAVAPERFRHVLVPLDGSTFAEEVLPHLTPIAAAMGARVTLVRVVGHAVTPAELSTGLPIAVPFGSGGSVAVIDEEATERLVAAAQAYLDGVAARMRAEPALTVDARVLVGDWASSAILEAVAESRADLVAMTTHGHGASRLLTGSTVDAVMRGRDGATLLVRPPRE